MSRRYGRNQRRAHRQELAEAQKQNEHLQSTVSLLRETGRRNADCVRFTAEVLGKHFATLPDSVQVVSKIPESIRLPQAMRFRGYVAEDVVGPLSYTLHALEANRTELRLDDIQKAMRVTYRTPTGIFAYAMTLDAWDLYPDEALREIVVREVAESIALQVVKTRNAKRTAVQP